MRALYYTSLVQLVLLVADTQFVFIVADLDTQAEAEVGLFTMGFG